ncbi:MAG TPA: hypothetical protein VL098_06380 [Flavipsychrobacter sp.]|nr:hypothetical protein [Flavipsychrobacter sp.]
MEKKKSLPFTFIIVAIILGVVLYKQFNFETLRFEKPALAIVYMITFIVSISLIVKSARSKS